MLSSIHPLGERARQNRWGLTVGSFTIGAMASGALTGSLAGLVGSLTLDEMSADTALWITAGVAISAAILDLSGVTAPGPKRQVNETWIGAFRGWVYGGAFGLELGVGTLTYVVTWGVYAMYAAAVLTASPLAGALIGALFGLGRASTLLVAGYVDRPSRLTSFNRALSKAGPSVRRGSSVALAGLGVAALAMGLT